MKKLPQNPTYNDYKAHTATVIYEQAQKLVATGKTMKGYELIDVLNKKGCKSLRGTSYSGGRGVYAAISAAYRYIKSTISQDAADDIAAAYVNRHGKHAYK